MEIIVKIFDQVLYLPLLNALIWIYNILPFRDLGIAIVILTIIIRFILYPLSKKAIQSQKAMAKLQPDIKEVQKKFKDKEEQAKQMMLLYKKHKINPAAGCLPILVQFPVLIALYRVFFTGLNLENMNNLYGFIQKPETLNFMFLGLIDLSQRSIFLALLAGGLQFVQSKMIMPQKSVGQKSKGSDMASMMGQQMMYFMPIITVFIAWRLPAALPLYWVVITLFGIIQQHFTKT
ncbi:YidC/Oxa1 family membrane protein insertase [Patescibacteria group bacterium]|nr:YidC/Oxa1 family membrane protein insertase [Patescibacteria group bacterium]MBU4030739.1 YidC/Oxa1 family membrane protein insertase [Patescibacteria group bacterium]MBU4082709.1 YidC/Oxa1 family membrane protein insertase [Patescibacteria group bacterium]MCG2809315.1 YidC/Oxa1 family membrane protein insertase [Candidatus Portnoybacteria bacterium]